MSYSFEGDTIRPLGLVTLHFGYAESEIDELLRSLVIVDSSCNAALQWPIGRKLSHVLKLVRETGSEDLDDILQLLLDATVLFDRRNAVVHNPIYSGTELVNSRTSGREQKVTAEELTKLANEISSCRHKLCVSRQRILEPLLLSRGKDTSTSQ